MLTALSSIGGLIIAASVVVGGIYFLARVLVQVSRWTATVSRAMSENTASNKELTGRMDKMSAQLDNYDRRITANQERLELLERERKWNSQHQPPRA